MTPNGGGRNRTKGRVALVHDWLNGMRGGEKVFEVLCELFPDATVFTLFYEPESVSDTIRRMNVAESPLARLPGARERYRALLPLFPRAVERFPTSKFDCVISTSHCVAKGARPPGGGPHICYCFTPMRYVWDQFDQYFPPAPGPDAWVRLTRQGREREAIAMAGGWARRAAAGLLRPRLQAWDRASADRVDYFLADSKNVARKIARYYRRRASVLYPPADTDYFTPPSPPPEGDAFQATKDGSTAGIGAAEQHDQTAPFLVVSALVPYKRIDRAILAANRTGHPLIVIGDGPERARLESLAGPNVVLRGWVANDILRAAYRQCRALLYPGEEDFGITAVEAQACGRPVIALGRGGALETVRDGKTGLFFENPSPEGLAEAMDRFVPEAFSPAACRANAERFRRERFKQLLSKFIGRALANYPHNPLSSRRDTF